MVSAPDLDTDAPQRLRLGGEMSGHLFFGERWYGFDDAMYTAARLLEILSRHADPSAVLDYTLDWDAEMLSLFRVPAAVLPFRAVFAAGGVCAGGAMLAGRGVAVLPTTRQKPPFDIMN